MGNKTEGSGENHRRLRRKEQITRIVRKQRNGGVSD